MRISWSRFSPKRARELVDQWLIITANRHPITVTLHHVTLMMSFTIVLFYNWVPRPFVQEYCTRIRVLIMRFQRWGYKSKMWGWMRNWLRQLCQFMLWQYLPKWMRKSTHLLQQRFGHQSLIYEKLWLFKDCPCNTNCPDGCNDCSNPICVCGGNSSSQNKDNLQQCMIEKSINLGQCIIDCNRERTCEQSCVNMFNEQYDQCPCQVGI